MALGGGGNVLGSVANKASAEASGFGCRQPGHQARLRLTHPRGFCHDRYGAAFGRAGTHSDPPSASRQARATAAMADSEA